MKHIKPFIFESSTRVNRFPAKLANFLLDESSHILSIIDDIGIISKDNFYIKEFFISTPQNEGVDSDVSEIFISGKSLASNSEILAELEKSENFDLVQHIIELLYNGGMVTLNIDPFEGDSITNEDYRSFSNTISRLYPDAKVSKKLASENWKGGRKDFITSVTIKIDYKSLLR